MRHVSVEKKLKLQKFLNLLQHFLISMTNAEALVQERLKSALNRDEERQVLFGSSSSSTTTKYPKQTVQFGRFFERGFGPVASPRTAPLPLLPASLATSLSFAQLSSKLRIHASLVCCASQVLSDRLCTLRSDLPLHLPELFFFFASSFFLGQRSTPC
jgi:hypothetical protein